MEDHTVPSTEPHLPAATRYAVYFTPEPSSLLWQLGSSIVGYDSITRQRVAPPDEKLLRILTDAIQHDPRRYGFHATLRSPFELVEGRTEGELIETAAAFARNNNRFTVGPLTPGMMGHFAALLCDDEDPSPSLQRLAADCVTTFEPFRRPLTSSDRQRRMKTPLTPRQITYLDAWGYPYVFEEFIFHMTLTGRLRDEDRDSVFDALRELFAPIPRFVEIDAVTLLVQPTREAGFHILGRYRFGGFHSD